MPPIVSILTPLDGAVSYTTNALIIDVAAADTDGTVTQVSLFRDGVLLASADTSPYEFELINLPEGTNLYTASAIDDKGAETVSAPVRIFELSEPPIYYAPSINFSSPGSNAVFIAPTNLTLAVQITDRGYPVKVVSFGANNTNLGEVSNPPFSWTITNIAIGTYTFTAIVTDAGGYVASGPPLTVNVIPNPATTPAVSIIGPTNGAILPVGQNSPLSVSVTPNGNVIQRVDFYVANTVIGSVAAPPYSLLWKPSIVGPACWQAVAVYGQAQSAASPASCVNVVLVPGTYPQYVVADLGPLRSNSTSAFGLNGLGHFVGDWPTNGGNDQPFLDVGGVITVLNTPPLIPGYAAALNDSDQILINANLHGYIYNQGQITDLGSLGGMATFAHAINANGKVAGDSQLTTGTSHAVLFDGQKLIDLAPSSPSFQSQGLAINDLGVVAGWAQNSAGQFPFLYSAQSGMRAIPNPPGGSQGSAEGVNNLGNAVGNACYANTATRRGFVYLNGTTKDLGTLGDQLSNSDALSINNSNQVVGYSQVGTDRHAFLWQSNVLYDINLLIPSNSVWRISMANAINDLGQIVGIGRFGTNDRADHAVLLNPLPMPGQPSLPPRVAVVAPTTSSLLPSGTDVPITASVIDQDALITNVSFYAGNQGLGSVTSSPPYVLTWSNAPAGVFQLTAVALDSLGAVGTSAPVSITIKAPYPGAPRIALLSGDISSHNADIQRKLVNDLLFSAVEVIPVTSTDPVPTLAQLLSYDAVMVYTFQNFNAPDSLGDLLADFVDAGHGVVLALYSQDTAKSPLSGRVAAQDYLPWAVSGDNFAGGLTLVKLLPQHPILAGIQSFNGGTLGYYQQNASATPGSVLLANWSNGQKLVAARQVGAGRLVGLNFFPVSSDVYSGWWSASTDGAKLMGNALLWAAGAASETATLSTTSNVVDYLPGQDIDLTVGLTNAPAGPVQVDIFTNNNLLISLTNAPFDFHWSQPPIGNYLTFAAVTDAQSNLVTTKPLPLSVDSRLTVNLLSPTNGTVIYYPTNFLFQVSVSDLDAAIVSVDYYLNATQFIGRSTNAPYSFNWNVGTVGTFPINAVATDALGARHSSASSMVSVIQYDPNKPVQTFWSNAQGDWLAATNWSNGVPRSQDSAFIDNNGTASLAAELGTAANLTIGLNATGALVQTAGNLSVSQILTLGQNTGSSGYYQLDVPGQLSEGQLILGLGGGAGHFVQNGGTNSIKQYLETASNSGGTALYELFGGELNAPSEYITGLQTGMLHQRGGTNSVQGLVVGDSQRTVTGIYNLEGGLLNVGTESINSRSPAMPTVTQSGGTHAITQALNVGDQGQGQLIFSGGTLRATQLLVGTGGLLDITVGGQTNGIEATTLTAQLNSRLVLHLAPGYTPKVGDSWPLVSYGSYQGTFARVSLPPATNGVAWQISYLTNQLILTATKLPNIIVVSPVSPTTQSNLFYQIVQITNPGSQPLAGARVFITGLPPGMAVYNASGTVGGVPFVEYDSPIAPGQTVQFYVQLLTQTTPGAVVPNLIVDVTTTNQFAPPPAALSIEGATHNSDGSFILGFDSVLNQTYYIQYSSDLKTWKTVGLPVIGVGNRLEWLDNGPPRTDSLPGNQPERFYRITSP